MNGWLYLLVGVILLLLELVYFRVADKCNIIDKPNLRSSHTTITLRGGGIIFLFAAWVAACLDAFAYPYFLTGLTLIAGISFWDDIRSVPNRIRICIHFGAMLLLFVQVGLFGDGNGWWYILPALIICTGIINAYNFMDGINGITAGYSLAVWVPLYVLNLEYQYIDENLLICTLLAILIFGYFNFRQKARCFAGDVGSVGIAFILLFIWGCLVWQTKELGYLVFWCLYGADSILTIIHRLMLHENIFQPHRKHAYQLMANELHVPHTRVASGYMVVQLIISMVGIWLEDYLLPYMIAVCLVVGIGYVIFMSKYYYLHENYLKSKGK